MPTQSIGITILALILAAGLIFAVYNALGGETWCAARGGILLEGKNQSVCIKQDAIIVR